MEIVRERLDFQRGLDPKQAMGIGLIVSFTSECTSVWWDDEKEKMNLSDPDTKYFHDYLKKHKIKYEYLGSEGPGLSVPRFRFTGFKKDIINLLMNHFNAGAFDDEETRRRLNQLFQDYNEQRDVEKLWDILT